MQEGDLTLFYTYFTRWRAVLVLYRCPYFWNFLQEFTVPREKTRYS